jgi:hypothetical protein
MTSGDLLDGHALVTTAGQPWWRVGFDSRGSSTDRVLG